MQTMDGDFHNQQEAGLGSERLLLLDRPADPPEVFPPEFSLRKPKTQKSDQTASEQPSEKAQVQEANENIREPFRNEDPKKQVDEMIEHFKTIARSQDIRQLMEMISDSSFSQSLSRWGNFSVETLLMDLLLHAKGEYQFKQERSDFDQDRETIIEAFNVIKEQLSQLTITDILGKDIKSPQEIRQRVTDIHRQLHRKIVNNIPEVNVYRHLLEKVSQYARKVEQQGAEQGQLTPEVIPQSPLPTDIRAEPKAVEVTTSNEPTVGEHSSLRFYLPAHRSPEAYGDAQPWLDLEREKAFRESQNYLVDLNNRSEQHTELKQWFIDNFNHAYKLEGDRRLTQDDVSSLQLQICESTNASKLANHQVIRPVLVFTDKNGYSAFNNKVFNSDQDYGFYLVFPHDNSTTNPIVKSGLLIMGPNEKGLLEHEIKHSIDGNCSRVGYNQLLSELVAYFSDEIGNPNRFRSILSHSSYLRSFSANLPPEEVLDRDSYTALVDQVITKTMLLNNQYGDLTTQRKIFASKTINEFLQLA